MVDRKREDRERERQKRNVKHTHTRNHRTKHMNIESSNNNMCGKHFLLAHTQYPSNICVW